MEDKMNDVWMMGIGQETYKELYDIAKKEKKSVVDVASEALKKHIDNSKNLQEEKKPRLLMEG
jgi:predicted CopG family antitoxin